jgi:large subunit ribosomal protein L15
VRKLPYKRGFNNPFRVEYEPINLDQLERLPQGLEVTPDALRAHGMLRRDRPVKILARGKLTRAVTVHAHAFSQAARDAITAAGGSAVDLRP